MPGLSDMLPPLSEQRHQVPDNVLRAIEDALTSAEIVNFKSFNRVIMRLVAHGVAGNVTPDQIRAITPLMELLFASLAAQMMREDRKAMDRVHSERDPIAAAMASTQATAHTLKIRPSLEMNDDGTDTMTIVGTTKQGKRVLIMDQEDFHTSEME